MMTPCAFFGFFWVFSERRLFALFEHRLEIQAKQPSNAASQATKGFIQYDIVPSLCYKDRIVNRWHKAHEIEDAIKRLSKL
jgi:hypothetical protein